VRDLAPGVQRILERYEARPRSRFPTKDINKLTTDPDERGRLHGRIDVYLSGIAGYASGAARLNRRPASELQAASKFLSQSFFEKYPEYALFRGRITEQETPDLFAQLEAAELNRADLLQEVEHLVRLRDEN
jgi:hypothetical protein